jgi:hypothetical protein
MAETNLKKNKEGYGYKYTELAEIHNYLESINAKYIQKIARIETEDYIMTKRCFNDKWEDEWLQGCRVVQATLSGIKNPAQEQGSALTYARRYSLLMAFGLATEDDDGASLTQKKEKNEIITLRQAEDLKLTFGKYKGSTLGDITCDDPEYCNWLYTNEKTDINIKKALKMISVARKQNEIVEDLDTNDKHQFDGEP